MKANEASARLLHSILGQMDFMASLLPLGRAYKIPSLWGNQRGMVPDYGFLRQTTVDSRYLKLLISNNRLPRSKNLVPVLTQRSTNRQ